MTDPTVRVELFDPGRSLTVGTREMKVAARRGTAEHPILVLEDVPDRAAAEALRGEAISVPRAEVGEIPEGEFLVDDLVGCEVLDGTRRVGRVQDVLLLPAADTLEVERPGEDPLLVPLIGDAVRSIDTSTRTIDVDMSFLGAA